MFTKNIMTETEWWSHEWEISDRPTDRHETTPTAGPHKWNERNQYTSCSLYCRFRLTFPCAANVNLSLWHTTQKLRATFY